MNASGLAAAVEGWKNVVGSAHVVTNGAEVADYCSNVSALRREVRVVLRPASTEEVREIVRIANEHGTPLYPVSCGKNLGLGSRLPVQDGACIVDLARMNRIREVNVGQQYAVVEAGVSQGQLYDHLVERGLPLVLNVTGCGRGASLIGNALERGVGYFSSREESLSGMEIVLGNGTILRTGFSHFPHARTTHAYRHGVGPFLDGLFLQSNYGIVTCAGVDLMPRMAAQSAIIASLYDERCLAEFIEILAGLRRSGSIQTIIHIANKNRTEITMGPLVYEILRRQAKNGEDLRKQTIALLASEGFGPWSAVIGFHGTRRQLAIAQREVRDRLGGLARILFLTDRNLAVAKALTGMAGFIPYFRRKHVVLNAIEPLYGLSKGIPTDAALASLYWPIGEMPPPGSCEADRDSCGMLYCLPMLPVDGRLADIAMRRSTEIFRKHGFVPCTTLNIMSNKAMEAVITLSFDRRRKEAVDAAHRCHDETLKYLFGEGLIPYRVGIQAMSTVVDEQDSYWETVRDLKEVLDPKHIIAPGRYNLV